MRSLREYIKALLIEKELRGQKDKRTLYHIGTHPADPKPAQTRHADQQWDRPWLSSPVTSGVFLTPNPANIAQFHGISGNVYVYKVPEWVIEKSGGIQRFDQGSEILIPAGIWDEAGDEIEFLGKSMSEKQLWDKVELSGHVGGPSTGSSKKPGWMTDEEWKKSKKQSAERSYVSGLRSTKHLKNAIKMMTPREREGALAAFESDAEKMTRSQEDILLPGREAPVSIQDQEIVALLKKHMNESLMCEHIRGLLIEIAIGQCYPHTVKMAQQVTGEEFSDLSKFKVAHGRITDKFSGESVLHAWVEKGDMIFDWQTHSTKPDGIDRETYYDMFAPEIHDEYTAEETMVNCLKSGGKAGPWK